LPLLRAAAAANHPIAQFQLGQMYETGAGGLVPQNAEAARKLYAAAASRGMKEASERLSALPPAPPAATPDPTQGPIVIPDPPKL
jgi:TPR repeat protein